MFWPFTLQFSAISLCSRGRVKVTLVEYLNFLDLTIMNVNNSHDFSMFLYPLHTETIIHKSSSHQLIIFKSFFQIICIYFRSISPLNVVNFVTYLNLLGRLLHTNNPLLFKHFWLNWRIRVWKWKLSLYLVSFSWISVYQREIVSNWYWDRVLLRCQYFWTDFI